MSDRLRVLIAGGGTGGHVLPAVAVARELQQDEHELLFVGTKTGLESRLVPQAGFPIEWIEIGGLNRVGWRKMLRSLAQLPGSVLAVVTLMRRFRPHVVFSTGGFVAGPVMLAAAFLRIPIVIMEPNAIPGLANRQMASVVSRALLNFEETLSYFPAGRAEVIGVPIRPEFFHMPAKVPGGPFTILTTGGSRGSRTLNRAARDSWPLFRQLSQPVRLIHLTGPEMHGELLAAFQLSGLDGSVQAFSDNMPELFSHSDLIICRSGAGAVAEVAAAGKAAILVPFPFASDQHQLRNAQALESAGAARLVTDADLNGQRLFEESVRLMGQPAELQRMADAARAFAHPGAAERAARVIVELGRQ